MSIRTKAAVAVCKAAHAAMRRLGRNGRALPGMVALGIDPKLIEHLGRDYRTIMISGTNGKTTTTHIVQQAVINTCGSAAYDPSSTNLEQGIATTLSLDTALDGTHASSWAVIESDEGASKTLMAALRPDVLVVTNLYRDQVDRYDTWTTARDYLVEAAQSSPNTVLVLDADCQVTSSIAERVRNKIVWFGMECPVYEDGIADTDEHVECVDCGAELEFDARTFAHLGVWRCPACGRERAVSQIACTAIAESTDTSCELTLRMGEQTHTVLANIRAGYDVYNAVAAVAGLLQIGMDEHDIFGALAHFTHAAHRFEVFDMGGCDARLLLMKNTAGCNQLINMLQQEGEPPQDLVCLLGAEIMDGRSTAWIQDVRWEKIVGPQTRIRLGGPKWEDMRDRLLRANADPARIEVHRDYKELVRSLAAGHEPVTVIANCSTIEALRVELVAQGFSPKDFWNE